MHKLTIKLFSLLVLLFSFTSCQIYFPGPDYHCHDYYNIWGEYRYTECDYIYYSQDGTAEYEIDLVAEIADSESFALNKSAEIYAEKFSLSFDKAMKIAKNVKDINALEDRSTADLADFAQKLYGVNPTEVVDAVSAAQVGNNAALDSVISEAAANFNTGNNIIHSISYLK